MKMVGLSNGLLFSCLDSPDSYRGRTYVRLLTDMSPTILNKKVPHFCETFCLVAETGLEPVTFGL